MRSRIVRIAVVLLALGVAVWLLLGLIETDEDRIEALVEEMRQAALAGDVDGVLAGVAEDVDWPGGRPALRRRLEWALREMPPEAITAEMADLEVEGDEATGVAEVVYRAKPRPVFVRLKVRFGRRGDRWVVVAADRF